MKRLARGVALTRTYPPQALCALDPRPLAFGALGGAAGELRLLVRRQDQRARLCPQPESWTETHRRKHLTQGEERVLGQEVPPPPRALRTQGALMQRVGRGREHGPIPGLSVHPPNLGQASGSANRENNGGKIK